MPENAGATEDVVSIWSQVRKIPWRRQWQPTPVFLPKMSYGERSLVGYHPWGCKRVGRDLTTQQKTPWIIYVMCLAQCQTEDWHLMKWLLKKKKKVFLLRVGAGGGGLGRKYIQVQKDPGWLVKNIFHFQRIVLLGTVHFWNFPFQTPSLTI